MVFVRNASRNITLILILMLIEQKEFSSSDSFSEYRGFE